jgi:hypothetical protein
MRSARSDSSVAEKELDDYAFSRQICVSFFDEAVFERFHEDIVRYHGSHLWRAMLQRLCEICETLSPFAWLAFRSAFFARRALIRTTSSCGGNVRRAQKLQSAHPRGAAFACVSFPSNSVSFQ